MPILKKQNTKLKSKSSDLKKRLRNKPDKVIFNPYFEKKIDSKYIDTFWKKYFSGKLTSFLEKRTS
jgi:ribosomal protein S4